MSYFEPNPVGKMECLKQDAVQARITQVANNICDSCNYVAKTPHGQGKPFAVRSYKNNKGFPHAGVYTATTYGCHYEKKHQILKQKLSEF